MEAVAKFTFAASQGDELSFQKGSVLNVSYRGFASDCKPRLLSSCRFQVLKLNAIHFQVLDKDEDKNWYKAEQGDREGWIPNTYITMKPHK